MKQEHFFYLFDLDNLDNDVKEATNKDVTESKIVEEVNNMLSGWIILRMLNCWDLPVTLLRRTTEET